MFGRILKNISMIVICLLLVGSSADAAKKDCDWNGDIGKSLDNCLDGSYLVDGSGNMDMAKGVKDQIIDWTNALSGVLALIAVGAIVYGGILLTLSGGEEERIKKGKDVIKWALIGFLVLIFSGAIIRIIVELIYSIGG